MRAQSVRLPRPSAPPQEAPAPAPHIVYLIHDACDPAIARRVRMLKMGGAQVKAMGFRRSRAPVDVVEGVEIYDLGQTHDAKLWARAGKVAWAALTELDFIRDEMRSADIVLARNLEMLALAVAARAGLKRSERPRLVYECLDIHRAMVGKGVKSQLLRAIERVLMRSIDLLMVSSPGFMRHYFEPMQKFKGAWLLVENKLLVDEGQETPKPSPLPKPKAPPWRIGWFGVLRCQKSLDLLDEMTREANGEVEVILRGRPAYHEFRDFDDQIAANPKLTFLGPYVAQDLPRIYGDVHFAWAVDYFDAGANSDWLLPNRYYEAGAFGVPVIARVKSELARAMGDVGIPLGARICGQLSADQYDAIVRNVAERQRDFCTTRAGAREIVQALSTENLERKARNVARQVET